MTSLYNWFGELFCNTNTGDILLDHIDFQLDTALGNLAQFNSWRFLLTNQCVKLLPHYQMSLDQFNAICAELRQLHQHDAHFVIDESNLNHICAKMPLPRILTNKIACELSILHQAPTFVTYELRFNIRDIIVDTLLDNSCIKISNREDLEPIFSFS